jgi:hypothetical protein
MVKEMECGKVIVICFPERKPYAEEENFNITYNIEQSQ